METKFTLRSNYDYIFKIVVIGDPAVGKTSMMCRYTDNKFYEEHLTTIGVDFKIKTLTIGEKKVKLNIWDTAGQERFSSIVESYFRGAKGVICVFSFENRKSFTAISKWLDRIEPYLIPRIILVGNKCDLIGEERKVTREEIDRFLKECDQDIEFIETSALTGENISRVFLELTTALVDQIEELSRMQVEDMNTKQVFTLQGVDPYAPKEEQEIKRKCCS